MKKNLVNILASLVLVVLFGHAALSQSAQFQIPLTVTNGTNTTNLQIGISGDGPNPPGALLDNTVGVDFDALLVEPGYVETSLPPLPPTFAWDSRIVTIPGRVATFPTGLGAGVSTDYRDFRNPGQVDSFKIVIAGDDVDLLATTISWPSNLNLFGSTWIIKPQTGTEWPITDMLATTSLTLPAGVAQRNIIIIKTGAFSPSPGPNFVLSSTSLNFGNVPVGGNATQQVQVTNTGTVNALNITGVTPIPNYTVVPNPPGAFPLSVAPGASRSFDVTFSPTAPGVAAGNIVFAHNAPGGTANLAVTGTGQSQGGTLQFAGASRTRFDNTTDYRDSLQLVNYVGDPLKALQLHIVTNGLLIVRGIERGSDIPAGAFSFSSVIARGAMNADGSTNDTIKVVIFGNGSSALPAGTYNSLVRFSYDVVNISEPDVQNTTIALEQVLGGLSLGGDAGVVAGPAQGVTVNNKTVRGDINNDDHVDVLDLLTVVDHILNRITLTGDALTRGDVAPWPVGDGMVNVLDLGLLQNIILVGQYPDGTPLEISNLPPIAGTGGSNGPAKLNAGVDAKLTFHVTGGGIAIRLEAAVPVKGMQVEFGSVTSVPPSMQISTLLGDGFQMLVNTTLRVLMYNQNSTVLAPGEYIVAQMPFDIGDPSVITLENLVIAGEDNTALENVESEFSYTEPEELPTEFRLSQNYPNPFNPTTDIKFSVPQTSDVKLAIYNMLGQEVRTLVSGVVERGTNVVRWDGKDNNGKLLSSGTYLYRMTAGSFVQSNKMVLLK